LQEDRKHLKGVSHPRLADTPFRSPQLTLIDLSPQQWVLFWHTPEYAPVRRKPQVQRIVQLALFDIPAQQKAVGANGTVPGAQQSPFLHLVRWGSVALCVREPEVVSCDSANPHPFVG
jgi:hypothetical protein